MEHIDQNKERRARKRIKQIKQWYSLIPVYVLGTLTMLALVLLMWSGEAPIFILIILMTGPILWWVFFTVQGLNLFGKMPKLMKNWEMRQIQKYIKRERVQTDYQ
jgi:hypothetical protein